MLLELSAAACTSQLCTALGVFVVLMVSCQAINTHLEKLVQAVTIPAGACACIMQAIQTFA